MQNLLITTDSYDEESVHFIEPETGNEVFKIDGSSLDNYYAVCSYQQRPMPDPMPEGKQGLSNENLENHRTIVLSLLKVVAP